jgi:hypothetical protein
VVACGERGRGRPGIGEVKLHAKAAHVRHTVLSKRHNGHFKAPSCRVAVPTIRCLLIRRWWAQPT